MAKYSVSGALSSTAQNLSSSYKTIVAVFATTAVSAASCRRIKIYDLMLGTDGTPADNAIVWDVSRQTADGTATTVTPLPLDPADSAMLGVAKVHYSAEGTITAASDVFNVGVNQRASYRWVAAPGSELVGPATHAAGFALRAKSPGYTSTVTAALLVEEQ